MEQEIVVKLFVVFLVCLLIVLTGALLFSQRPEDEDRKRKGKRTKTLGALAHAQITQTSQIDLLEESEPPIVISRPLHSPCMGCGLVNAKRDCSYNCCASCCRGNMNSVCRVHGTGYHACVLAVQAATDLCYSQIDFSYAHLKKCPPGLSKIGPQLVSLNISNNRLVSLPADIGLLVSLQELFIQYNRLSTIPDSVCVLKRLVELDIKNNSLTHLPECVGSLRSLVILNLTNNLLTSLPASVGDMSRLEELCLHGNKLTQLPRQLCNLTRLKTLYAGENSLRHLPERFGQLVQLEECDLSDCELVTLPESLSKCGSLSRLWLSNNKLVRLPHRLGDLSKLKELHVRNNRIKCFPASIHQLNLYTFSAQHNCLLSEVEATAYSLSPNSAVPPLLELSARAVLGFKVQWQKQALPQHLNDVLNSSIECYCCKVNMCSHFYTSVNFKTVGSFKTVGIAYHVPVYYCYCSLSH